MRFHPFTILLVTTPALVLGFCAPAAQAQCYRPCPPSYYAAWGPVNPCGVWYGPRHGGYVSHEGLGVRTDHEKPVKSRSARKVSSLRGGAEGEKRSRKTARAAKPETGSSAREAKSSTYYTSSYNAAAGRSQGAGKRRSDSPSREPVHAAGNKQLIPIEPASAELPDPHSY